jgi:transcriptional regulator with XRE-family HTH domain
MYSFSEEEIIEFNNKIAENVKRYRKEKGKSQLELAIDLGFANSSFISHAENPKMHTHKYSLDHLYKISKVLNINISDITDIENSTS